MNMHPDVTIAAVRLFVNLTLFGTPIAVGIAVAFGLTRPFSPRARYLIAVMAFFAVALIPCTVTFHETDDVLPLPRASSSFNGGSSNSDLYGQANKPSTGSPVTSSQLQAAKLVFIGRINTAVERLGKNIFGISFLSMWIVIAILLLGREIVGHVLLLRVRRTWRPAPPDVRQVLNWPEDVPLRIDDHELPCTFGFLRPTVVLPAHLSTSLSPEAARRVVKHELSHARWRDPFMNAVLRIVRAILWPSAPLWFIERAIRAEREVAADWAAIESSCSTEEKKRIAIDYARALVSVASRGARDKLPAIYNCAATHMSSRHLEERVHRLLTFSVPLSRTRLIGAGAFLFLNVLGIAFLPLSSQSLNPQTNVARRKLNAERRMLIASAGSAEAQQAMTAMNALIRVLPKRDWQLNGEVRSALEQIRSAGTIEPLLIGLKEDNDWRVREKLAWALGQLKDRRAVEPLITALGDDAGQVRHTAAWALGMIGDKRAIDALLANLKDKDSEARHGAAWALGNLRDSRAVERLISLLADRDADVRHGATWALGEIGDDRAVEPLKMVSDDPDPDVRAEVTRALTKLPHR